MDEVEGMIRRQAEALAALDRLADRLTGPKTVQAAKVADEVRRIASVLGRAS